VEVLVRLFDEGAVRGPLGGEDHADWQQPQPGPRDIDCFQRCTLLLEEVQCEDAVVDVVVPLCACDLSAAARAKRRDRRSLDGRHVVAEGKRLGIAQVGVERGLALGHREQLDGLAELAAGDPPLPGSADAIAIDVGHEADLPPSMLRSMRSSQRPFFGKPRGCA
jgi:hypothetical protein